MGCIGHEREQPRCASRVPTNKPATWSRNEKAQGKMQTRTKPYV